MKRRIIGSTTIHRAGWLGALVLATSSLLAPARALAQGWPGYAHDAQHSCLAVGGSQLPQVVRWKTPVDVGLAGASGPILIHYGTPVITRLNTVVVPVKTTGAGNYRVEARSGATGQAIWTATSDYALPSHDWVPIFGITLTPKDRYLAYPGGGGTVNVRTFPDSAAGTTTKYAFFGTSNYLANPSAFDASIQICTPISSDNLGNLYFGYVSNGAALPGYPAGIPSGLAKVSSTGAGSFVPATDFYANGSLAMHGIVSDPAIQKVAYNCAPSFSADGTIAYVAVNNGSSGRGYLAAVSASTLAPASSVLLFDPSTVPADPHTAFVNDDGSATPTVGPDGDVYYGVLAYNGSGNHYRGYLLHFDRTLQVQKLSNAFGWDDTASVVPSSAVPSYQGPSPYLLLTKYNNYADGGQGNGINQLAVVDPNVPMVDPISGLAVMQTVLTVNGITPDPSFVARYPNAVREWCINSAAIDVVNKCAVVNSEDGHVYRWDFAKNQLSGNSISGKPGLFLAPSTSEAYTPTVIGPDGAVYAINDAVLYSCVAN